MEQQPEHAEAFDIPDAHEHLPTLKSNPVWRRWGVILSLVLIAIVGAVWLYFTG